jgi:D-amino-acid dehydrogenase
MARIIVAGGGVAGLFAAWFLRREGHEVVVADKGDLSHNCSTGNAGMIVPSHVIPLASPGVVAKGLRWMFSSKSPFFIQASLDRELLRWGWLFFRSANARHVQNSLTPLANIGLYSRALYQDFMQAHPTENFLWKENGLLMLFSTPQGEREECGAAGMVQSAGIEARILSLDEVRALEPGVGDKVRGGVLYPGDALLSPSRLTNFLHRQLQESGVRFILNEEVKALVREKNRVVALRTGQRELPCDHLVIAAGAWSASLARQLGIFIPMRAGKGYSFMVPNRMHLQQPAILSEKKVTVSPFGEQIRFGGTMEITGLNHRVSPRRLQGIAESVGLYYRDYQILPPSPETVWSGLRPVSPDGLPYLGPSKRFENVYFSTGHSMMGVSLAPASGRIIADLVSGKEPPFPLEAFSADRFA